MTGYRTTRYPTLTPGTIIAYLPAGSTTSRKYPVPLATGVVIESDQQYRVRLQPLGHDDRPRSRYCHMVVAAAVCPECGSAAHHTDAGPRCPQCGAVCAPPSDLWVTRNSPGGWTHIPRLLAAALRRPDATRGELLAEIQAISKRRTAAAYTAAGITCEHPLWDLPVRTWGKLDYLIETEDVAGFCTAYQEAVAQAEMDARFERNLNALIKGLCGKSDAPVDPVIAAPPADMPADDRSPDGDDDMTRWLSQQAERHERRRAA